VDGNHKAIKKELESLGFEVADLSSCGDGVPDLLVARNGKQLLVEVKTARGRMTDDEIAFFGRWPLGLAIVARTTEDVLREWELL
jgi:hypothetical protein